MLPLALYALILQIPLITMPYMVLTHQKLQNKKLISSLNQKIFLLTYQKMSLPNMDHSPTAKTNLLGFDRKAMENFFVTLGEKPYRAEQILKWIHFNGTQDFHAMSNI